MASILNATPLYTGLAKIPQANAGVGCGNAGVFFGGSFKGTSAITGTEMYNTDSAMGLDLAAPQFNVTTQTAVHQLGQLSQSALEGGFSYDTVTNCPKPQWVPSATPWLKGNHDLVSVVNENAACWGTYLPASQPQTRRCQVWAAPLQPAIFAMQNANATFYIDEYSPQCHFGQFQQCGEHYFCHS
jgi:hypothetical protein